MRVNYMPPKDDKGVNPNLKGAEPNLLDEMNPESLRKADSAQFSHQERSS